MIYDHRASRVRPVRGPRRSRNTRHTQSRVTSCSCVGPALRGCRTCTLQSARRTSQRKSCCSPFLCTRRRRTNKSAAQLTWRRGTMPRSQAASSATATHRSRRRGHSPCLAGEGCIPGGEQSSLGGAGRQEFDSQACAICQCNYYCFFLSGPRESQLGPTATQDAPPHSTPSLGRAALGRPMALLPTKNTDGGPLSPRTPPLPRRAVLGAVLVPLCDFVSRRRVCLSCYLSY
jgi:hypothetical protein